MYIYMYTHICLRRTRVFGKPCRCVYVSPAACKYTNVNKYKQYKLVCDVPACWESFVGVYMWVTAACLYTNIHIYQYIYRSAAYPLVRRGLEVCVYEALHLVCIRVYVRRCSLSVYTNNYIYTGLRRTRILGEACRCVYVRRCSLSVSSAAACATATARASSASRSLNW